MNGNLKVAENKMFGMINNVKIEMNSFNTKLEGITKLVSANKAMTNWNKRALEALASKYKF